MFLWRGYKLVVSPCMTEQKQQVRLNTQTQFVHLTPSSSHWSLASRHLHKVPRGVKAGSNQHLKQPNSAANSIIHSNEITRSKLNLPCVECKCVPPQSWSEGAESCTLQDGEAVLTYCQCCIVKNCYTDVNNADLTVWTYHDNSDDSKQVCYPLFTFNETFLYVFIEVNRW